MVSSLSLIPQADIMHVLSFRLPLLAFALALTLACSVTPHAVAFAGDDPASIRKELEALRQDDQRLRNEEITARIKAREANREVDAEQARVLAERISVVDFGNQVRLDALVDRIGWPGQITYGREAALGAFMIVQHAALDYQLKYLPVLRAAADKDEIAKSWLAVLEDRVLVRQNQPQRYGSQVDTVNGVNLRPVEEEARLDQRRSEMGLEPICTYLARFEARAGKITYPKCAMPK